MRVLVEEAPRKGIIQPAADATQCRQAHSLVKRAVTAATAELDDAVAEMVGEVIDYIPEYGVISPDARRDYVAGVRFLTELALRVLGDGTPVTDGEVEAARCIGQARSAQGLSLQSVEDSVRTCFRVGLRRFCAHLRVQGPEGWLGEAFEEVTETMLSLEHQYVRALRAGYRHSEERKARARLSREQALLTSLLQGTYDDKQQLAQTLEDIGYATRGEHVILLMAATDIEVATRAATAFVGAFHRARQVSLVCSSHRVVAVLVPGTSPTEVMQIRAYLDTAKDHVATIVLPIASRLDQMAAYQGTAAVACQLRSVGVLDPLELAPYEVLTQDPAVARRFLAATLGPLLHWKSDRRDAVLVTLRAFLRHQAVKRVAYEVGISPQTVYNHLRALEEATGLSVPKYPTHWHLALLLRDLYGDT